MFKSYKNRLYLGDYVTYSRKLLFSYMYNKSFKTRTGNKSHQIDSQLENGSLLSLLYLLYYIVLWQFAFPTLECLDFHADCSKN